MEEQVPLYHGTRRGFTRGGVVMPRTFHRASGTSAPVNSGHQPLADSGRWVYVTESIDLAWAYAFAAAGRGKPKVLEVAPRGEFEPDPEHSPAMRAWRCEWASVLRVHTEPTMTEEEALAGWDLDDASMTASNSEP